MNISISTDLIEKVWRRHLDGTPMEISSMQDEHLQATIAMIKRGKDRHGRMVSHDRDAYLPNLEAEAVKRGLQPAEDGWDN